MTPLSHRAPSLVLPLPPTAHPRPSDPVMSPIALRPAARALAPLALLLAGACVAAPGGPGSPIVTDRPDFTESAVTVPGGRMQIEAGATYADEAGVDGLSGGEVLLRGGLSERLELRVGIPSYLTASDDRGFGDANLGAKVALFAPAEGASRAVPTVGLIVGSTLPTGTGGFQADGWQPEAKLLLAWTVTDRFAVASNLNYARVSEAGGVRYGEPSASLSGAFAITDVVGSYVEAFGFAPDVAGAPRPTYLNGGLTWLLSPDFQLDARVGVGVADAPDSRFVGLGLSRRW